MTASRRPVVGLAILAIVLDVAPVLAQGQKHVLILWGGRPDLPVNVVVNQTIRTALYEEFGAEVDLHFEYVEDPPSDADRPALRDFLRHKYASYRLDLLIAIANGAVDFARRYAGSLFPRVPVLCWGESAAIEGWGSEPPFTAVVSDRDPRATVRFILQAQPATRHLVIVAGTSVYDRASFLARSKEELQEYEGRLTFTYLTEGSLEEVRRQVNRLPDHSAILYVNMHGDAAGRRLVNVDAMASIAASANVPVYVMSASHLGAGALGGVVLSQQALSEAAGTVAVRILRGARVEDIPIVHVPLVPMADWRQLQRFRIPEANLPPGTLVLYREPSMWERYRGRVVGIAALCLGQALLILALLVQRTRRRQAERAQREQHRQLAHLGRVATLGEMTGTLAHELNQPLTAILSNAQAARRLLARDPPDLDELRATLDDIVSDDRRAGEVIGRLRGMLKRTEMQRQPVDVNEVVREVVALARSDLVTHGVAVVLQLQEGLPTVAADRVQLQQVLLNLVLNGCDAMVNGAEPKDLTVTSGRNAEGQVMVRVRDRGTGIAGDQVDRIFEPFFTSKREGLGLGLAISRTIAISHGGRLWASNNGADGGATLHLALPCAVPPRAAAER
jgi:signal transduction histidine kinase